MKFQKLFIIKKENDTYIASFTQHEGYEPHFTTEEGIAQIKPLLDEVVTFKQLPKPLLKQIR